MWIVFDLIAFFAKRPIIWIPAMTIGGLLFWASLRH